MLLSTIATLVGCGGADASHGVGSATDAAEKTRLISPSEDVLLVQPAPFGSGRVVVTLDPTPGGESVSGLYATKLGIVDLATGNVRELSLPQSQGCRATSRLAPRTLRDGRIAYVEYCLGKPPETATRLMAWDPAARTVSPVLDYFLPYFVGGFDFPSQGSRGVINDGRGLSERLAWTEQNRLEFLDLPLSRAGAPTWHPDGDVFAVPAVPSSAGEDSSVGPPLPRNVFVVDTDGRIVETIIEGVVDLSRLSWSPDGRWLALSGRIGDQSGLYVVDPEGRSIVLLRSGSSYRDPAWVPPGNVIVVSVGTISDLREGRPTGLEVISLDTTVLAEALEEARQLKK